MIKATLLPLYSQMLHMCPWTDLPAECDLEILIDNFEDYCSKNAE